MDAYDFYQSRRWGWPDAIAGILLVGSVLAISWLWFRFFIRAAPPSVNSVKVAG